MTKNTLATHILSSKCGSAKAAEMWGKVGQKRGLAWLISDGVDGVATREWLSSVFMGQTLLEEWSFVSPRPTGVMPPSSAAKLGAARVGAGNPMVAHSMVGFDKEAFETKVVEIFSEWKETVDSTKLLLKRVEEAFPRWAYGYPSGESDSRKKLMGVLSGLTGVKAEWWQKEMLRRRGLRISKGQKASDRCLETAAKTGAALISHWRVSRPHLLLFVLIRSVVPDAVIEKRVGDGKRHGSYDIFAAGKLVEMHGRAWHSQSVKSSTDRMTKLVVDNLEKDRWKEKMAALLGLPLFIFWDDEKDGWHAQVESVFGARPEVSLSEAEDQVDKITGSEEGLRSICARGPELRP